MAKKMAKEEKEKVNELIALTKKGEIAWVKLESTKDHKKLVSKDGTIREISIWANRFQADWQRKRLIFIERYIKNSYFSKELPDQLLWKDTDRLFYLYVRKNGETETRIFSSEGLISLMNPTERLLKGIEKYVKRSK